MHNQSFNHGGVNASILTYAYGPGDVTGNYCITLKETPEVQFTPRELTLCIWVKGMICP